LLPEVARRASAKPPAGRHTASGGRKLETQSRGVSGEELQRLSDAENRIAVERRHYNDMLEHYNALIQRFPENIVAGLAGFRRNGDYLPTPEPAP
jgi:hypothetical protein